MMRYGAAADERYVKLSAKNRNRREDLAKRYQYAQLVVMVLAVLVDLHGDGYTARRADRAMAHVMAMALKHGAYRAGIVGLVAKFGSSASTIKRASKQIRANGEDPAAAMLWRVRGQKGLSVTLWLPSTALVNAVQAKASRRKATKADRKAKRDNDSRTHGVKISHVAPPHGGAERRGQTEPRAVAALRQVNGTKPDITDRCTDDPETLRHRCAYCKRNAPHP